MADQTINIPRDTTMSTLAKDATLSSILAQLTAQQAKLQAITQALIDRDIIGNNSITGIGDGTLTGAVVSLNNGKQKTLVAGDNIAIDQSTGRIDVTGMDVSYNDLDDVPEDIAFYGDETAGAVEEIDPVLYASDVVNDLVTGGVAVPLSAEQGKILNSNLPKKDTVSGTTDSSGYVTTSISTSSRIILAAWIDGAPNNRVVTPFTNNSIYTMLVTNAQFVAATGQNVTIKYVYVDA